MKKLSIIIPCHNSEEYIDTCMDSIIKQKDVKDEDIEIIVVCDNCTDNTEKIVEVDKVFDRFDIKILKCKKGCAGLSRNVGFAKAKGEYIWFVDSDDFIIYPYAIRDILRVFEESDAKDEKADMVNFNFLWNNKVCRIDDNMGKLFCNIWSRVFRKDLISEIKFSDKQIGEDFEFMNAVLAKKPKIYILDKVVYYYNNPRIGSLTSGEIQ